MKRVLFTLFATVLLCQTAWLQNKYEWKEGKSGTYTYKYVTNDPTQTRIYTLSNGLTVMLSPNKKEPRIAFRMAVRAGSNTDPKDHTGLAHYLEHLLFKGTDQFGSLDWAKEKPELDSIDNLYENYNHTTDTLERKAIYKEIDAVSGRASHYSIANEYDKMMSTMGSQGTNAHTWVEETVYEEDIPSNAVDRLLAVQAERFRNPVLRIFHTELEAVYEEKNRSLDNDAWKVFETTYKNVFPTHNYGQQTTIGTIEHLKNPSLKAIREYYYKYYVPNNMAVVMAGDFDPDVLIKKIDAAFAYMKPKPVEAYNPAPEKPLDGPVTAEVFGPSAESVTIAFRSGHEGTPEQVLLNVVDGIFSNGKAGMLDLNLNKQQKVLSAGSSFGQFKDYGVFSLRASPKQGQSLEEAKDLLLAQIDKFKKGDFDETLIKAIAANYKLDKLRAQDNNTARVSEMVDDFIKSKAEGWQKDVAMLDAMGKVTKQDVLDFAEKFFTDKNYVIVYKRKGEDKSIRKVEKPAITPVETNAGKQSPFVAKINAMPLPAIKPVWVDYNTDMQKGQIGKSELLYVPNKQNGLFNFYYRFDMGKWNNKKLSVALEYLQYIGTDKYAAEDISKAFYQLAANFSTSAGNEESSIQLSGLNESFVPALNLLEEVIRNCKPDTAALSGLKNRLLKARANAKVNKSAIMQGLNNYAIYGASNPFNYTLSDAELNALTAEELVDIIHNLPSFKHEVLYYGPLSAANVTAAVSKVHKNPASWQPTPEAVKFTRTTQDDNKVFFSHYDMVQAEMSWVRNLMPYQPKEEAVVDLFNNYFGGNMGSIVFQTIRESKALAYATYAYVATPAKKEDPFTFYGYVGSQADKLPEAVTAMNELINDLPERETSFEQGRTSLLKDIETERIEKQGILFNYIAARKKGLSADIRKEKYEQAKTLTFKDIQDFEKQQLANKRYSYAIVGSEKNVTPNELSKYGTLKVLSLEELFGY
ncbi:MAG: insulinase family protein [Niabella sp.]